MLGLYGALLTSQYSLKKSDIILLFAQKALRYKMLPRELSDFERQFIFTHNYMYVHVRHQRCDGK